jgi:Concanavalin A-like lectin/glucanases superfamily/Calcineurin-like phosphoesterase
MKMKKKVINYGKLNYLAITLLTLISVSSTLKTQAAEPDKTKFHFTVTSDAHMGRSYADFAKFTCPAILANPSGPGAFMVNTGDFDVFTRVNSAINEQLIQPLKAQGKDYYWYPVPGNHDLYNTSNDPKFRTKEPEKTQTRALIEYNKNHLKHIVNWGPDFESKLPGYENNGSKYTNYSFDYGNCHFVVLDLFYSNSIPARGCGNFHSVTEKWLENDLKANKKPHVFVFGHHPVITYKPKYGDGAAIPEKHLLDFRRKQLWNLLKKYKVDAYLCGHIHKYGVMVKDGITQITNGKSGLKSQASYVMIFVDSNKITYKSYLYRSGAWQELAGTINPRPTDTPLMPVKTTAVADTVKKADKPTGKPVANDKLQSAALIGYWSFDADSGSIVTDASGNNNGVVHGSPEYVAGVHSKAIIFDGTTDFIKIPAGSKKWRNLKQLTLMGWFYRDDGAEGVTGIDKAQNYRLTAIAVNGTSAKWKFSVVDNKGKFHSLTSPKAVKNNEWHHIAGTYDGKTLKLYIDGIEVKSRDDIFEIKDAGGNFEIGRRDVARYFKGKIDEVGVYSTALSQEEISQLK